MRLRSYATSINSRLKSVTGYDGKDLFLLVFLAAGFCITVIRAAITQVTFDEAQTYIWFCKPEIFTYEGFKDLYWNSIANNHLLNTYLITVVEMLCKEKYSEFLIRLPQLLFYLIYITAVWKTYRNKRISGKTVIFLSANYYVSEFYGLARGYAMANTLVFLGCLCYLLWKESGYEENKYLIWNSVFLALAVTANTIVFLVLPSFGFLWLLRLIKNKKILAVLKRCFLYLVVWFGYLVLILKYHMNVIAVTTPEGVYTGREMGFFESFFIGYAKMFSGNRYLYTVMAIAFAVYFAALAGVLIYLKKLQQCDLVMQAIIFVAMYLIAQAIYKIGYATGRELVPFYAFMVLALCEGTKVVADNIEALRMNYRKLDYAVIFACAVFVCIFIKRLDVNSTTEWNHEYGLREHTIKQYIAYDGDTDKFDKIHSMVDYFYIFKMDEIKYSSTAFE